MPNPYTPQPPPPHKATTPLTGLTQNDILSDPMRGFDLTNLPEILPLEVNLSKITDPNSGQDMGGVVTKKSYSSVQNILSGNGGKHYLCLASFGENI